MSLVEGRGRRRTVRRLAHPLPLSSLNVFTSADPEVSAAIPYLRIKFSDPLGEGVNTEQECVTTVDPRRQLWDLPIQAEEPHPAPGTCLQVHSHPLNAAHIEPESLSL